VLQTMGCAELLRTDASPRATLIKQATCAEQRTCGLHQSDTRETVGRQMGQRHYAAKVHRLRNPSVSLAMSLPVKLEAGRVAFAATLRSAYCVLRSALRSTRK
jgi:hypothetical protein